MGEGRREMRNAKGITLIELIVVMVIIAIGAVMLVPNMGAWMRNYRLSSATRDVVSVLRTAQMKAVTTNMEYRVYFNADERKYWIERGNSSSGSTNWVGTTAPDNAAREGSICPLPSGVTINLTGFSEFNTNSTCSSPGTIILSGLKGSKRISFATATGRIRVE